MNRFSCVAILLASTVIPQAALAQFEGMKYRIPTDANTVVLVNADKIFGSKVADANRWAERRQAAYDAGILALPPDDPKTIILISF